MQYEHKTCEPAATADRAQQEDKLGSAGLSGPSSAPGRQDQTHPGFCVPPCAFVVKSSPLSEDLVVAGKQTLRLTAPFPTAWTVFYLLLPVFSPLGSLQHLHQPLLPSTKLTAQSTVLVLFIAWSTLMLLTNTASFSRKPPGSLAKSLWHQCQESQTSP